MDDAVATVSILPDTQGAQVIPIEPAKLISGTPNQSFNTQFSNYRGNFHCGVWVSEPGTWRVHYTEDEFCMMLEGEAVLTDAAGVSHRYAAGDAFVVPAGFSGSWQSIGNVRKYYAIYEDP
jgi:uncharacterized cupin superfamily protein